MLQTKFLLKEFFKEHDYPFDLLNPIITYYIKVYNFEIFIEGKDNSSIIRTPDNQIHYWNVAGDHRKIDLPHIKKLIHGDCCAFAITQNNDLYSWGSNEYGQLGIDIPVEKYLNDQVKQATKVELSNVQNIVYLDGRIFAITIEGDVWHWGSIHNINKPQGTNLRKIKNIIDARLTITISDKDELYNKGNRIPNVKEVFTHNYRVIVLTSFGELFHFKIDREPRKVDLPNISKVIPDESWSQIILISGTDAYLWVPKSNTLNKIEISNVKDVAHGGENSLALTHDHDVYFWGTNNIYGKRGAYNDKKIPQKIFSNVRKMICDEDISCVITYDNELYTWDYDYYVDINRNEHVRLIQKIKIENVKDIYYRNHCLIIVTWLGEIYYCGKWYDQSSNIPKLLEF